MTDTNKPLKEFILKHPSESGNWIYQESKKVGLGIRKQNFYGVLRETRNLSKPSIEKKVKSIPIKYRKTESKIKIKEYELRDLSRKPSTKEVKQEIRELVKEITKLDKTRVKLPKAKPKEVKIPKIDFKDTKFGKITKRLEKAHNIKESKAILHARKILKIPKSDYHKINEKDVQILLDETP